MQLSDPEGYSFFVEDANADDTTDMLDESIQELKEI